MNSAEVSALEGSVVLVCSSQDQRNPPTGRRGTLRASHDPARRMVVSVEMEFPQMFTTRAHRRSVELTEEQVDQMLETEDYGAFTVVLDERLDPEAPPENESGSSFQPRSSAGE